MNGTILLIEDDKDIAKMIGVVLQREGYRVITARNGRMGLELAFAESPDLIILDLMLPDANGLNICRQMRAGELQAPILMLTALAETPDKVTGLEAGADDYLVKPFDLDELLARLRALQRRHTPMAFYRSRDNPYIVGAPVPPDRFFGRRHMIGAIVAAIQANNHLAIYGERRIGKTSLLHRLAHLLKKEGSAVFVPLFIQMQMFTEEKFFAVLMDALLKSIPPPVKDALPPLARPTISVKYEALDFLDDLETVLENWLRLVQKPLQLVFLLDEGDRLNEFSEATQMQLRGLLQDALINRHVRLVWCGTGINRTWRSDTSPWFNLFKAEFHVESLRPEDARRLILEPVAGIYDYEEEAIDKILALSEGKPYLIQRLCSNCIDYLQEREPTRSRITRQDVETAWTVDRESPLKFGDLTLSPVTRMARRGKRMIELTTKEFDMLELFMRYPNQTLSRDQIYEHIWRYRYPDGPNVIDTYIRYLRSKLEASGEPRLLHTVGDDGFTLRQA